MNKILSNPRLVPFLTLCAGTLILLPGIYHQTALSTGDHGIVLYGAEAVLRGEKPFRDFSWLYGPLMLYYYGFFMKILGIQITSVLFGKFLINLLCGFLLYKTLTRFIQPLMAMGASLWFWLYSNGFFYTYNHIGGTILILYILFCLFNYIVSPSRKPLYFGSAACFLLLIIKLNIGAFNLLGFVGSVILIDRFLGYGRWKDRLTLYAACFVWPAVLAAAVYALLLYDSPFYVTAQSLQLFGNDVSYYYGYTIMHNIKQWLTITAENIAATWQRQVMTGLFAVSLLTIVIRFFRTRPITDAIKKYLTAVGVCILFYILNLHELIGSGIGYRFNWVEAPQALIVFLVIGFAVQYHKPIPQALALILIALLVIYQTNKNLHIIRGFENKYPKFDLPRTGVYTYNNISWIPVVKDTVTFLNSHLKPDEKFLALPYDPLYYFLTDRVSPIRELALWKALGFGEEQEKRIIRDLKENNIQWIVLSSRVNSADPAIGNLGSDYLRLVGRYILNNYSEVASFGDTTVAGDWIVHSIKILKKKTE